MLHLTPVQWLVALWLAGMIGVLLWLLGVALLSRRSGRATQWDDPTPAPQVAPSTPGRTCRICGMTGGHWSGCGAIRRRGVTR